LNWSTTKTEPFKQLKVAALIVKIDDMIGLPYRSRNHLHTDGDWETCPFVEWPHCRR
jgi:hypothetical protein